MKDVYNWVRIQIDDKLTQVLVLDKYKIGDFRTAHSK
jgi:hypothetical protein